MCVTAKRKGRSKTTLERENTREGINSERRGKRGVSFKRGRHEENGQSENSDKERREH